MLNLLAEAVAGDMATPATIVGAFIVVCLSLVGLVGWLLKHVFATTIPDIQAEAKAQREVHATEQKAQREAHAAEQKAQREAHAAAVKEICGSYEAQSNAERQLCEKQFALINAGLTALTAVIGQDRSTMVAAINQHVTESMAAYRHDIYDRLNEAVLGRDLYNQRKLVTPIKADQGVSAHA